MMNKFNDKGWLEGELKMKSQRQVEQECGVTRGTVKKWMDIHGILSMGHHGPARKSNAPPRAEYLQLQNKNWLQEELKKKSKLQIAREIGCSYSAVTYMANKHEIQVGRSGVRAKSLTRGENVKKAIRKRFPGGRLGENAPGWKGGVRKKVGTGYIGIFSPEHPFATKGGYVVEHRLVMESHIGRYLKPWEVIHHINKNKTDNRIENLELIRDNSTHLHKHGMEKATIENLRLRSLLEEHGIDPDE